jgi:hypothetical protein
MRDARAFRRAGSTGAVGARPSLRPPRFGGTWRLQQLGRKRAAGMRARVSSLSSRRRPGPLRRGLNCPCAMAVAFPSTTRLRGYGPRPPPGRLAVGPAERSPLLTIFWHCGHWHFSSRTARHGVRGNEPSTVLADSSPIAGLGNADSRRKWRDFGWGGRCRSRARDSGCVPAHPPYWRASASYRPLRAVWAVCAWALRGSREIEKTLQRPVVGALPKRNLQP